MANAAIRFGFPALGIGLLSFMVLFVTTGGIGPCADDAQMTTLFWCGVVALGISSVSFLVPVIVGLIRKHKSAVSA
jgi:hypothetical protein